MENGHMTRAEAEDRYRLFQRLQTLGFTFQEAETLRRISMTLRRWHEGECGNSNDFQSWCLVRGRMNGREFTYDEDGAAYLEVHPHRGDTRTRYERVPDRERGARERLERLVSARNQRTAAPGTAHTALGYYVQPDPRGCALYLLPAGVQVDNYTDGIAVY